MRRTSLGVAFALYAGCANPTPAVPAAAPSAPVGPATPQDRDAPPRQATQDAGKADALPSAEKAARPRPEAEAIRAYVATTEARAAKDAAAYFGAFADPMRCFYGKSDISRSALEEARGHHFDSAAEGAGPLATMAIELVRVSPDEVLLLHWGVHRDGPGEALAYPLFHRKWVGMTAIDGEWRIASEFSLGTSRCYDGELKDVKPPPPNRVCIRSMGKCMPSCCKVGESANCEHCERQCAEQYEACLAKLE